MSKIARTPRLRRSIRTRARIKSQKDTVRLSIFRTPRHIYAQLISSEGDKTIAAASTLDKELADLKNGGNVEAAIQVGKLIAERAKKNGVKKVAFDRSGFKYHGRIKALADSAREAGLVF